MIRDLLRLVDRPGMLSLAGGLPAPELLPVTRLDQASRSVLDRAGPRALQYAPTEGVDELRAVVADDLAAPVDEVIITTGSQQAIDLLSRCLVDPGDTVVVESPGYLGALQAFQAADADVRAIPADADGMRTELLDRELRRGLRPKLVYVVATFQNPSGATLTLARRRHLAALADEFGFVVVEDDPYGELRFGGERPVRLRELSERVVTLGTASKTVAPGLRVGWAAAPEWLQSALVRAKQVTDLHTSPLTQLIAAEILGDAAFMRAHLAEIRATYGSRAEALVTSLEARLGCTRPHRPARRRDVRLGRLHRRHRDGGAAVAGAGGRGGLRARRRVRDRGRRGGGLALAPPPAGLLRHPRRAPARRGRPSSRLGGLSPPACWCRPGTASTGRRPATDGTGRRRPGDPPAGSARGSVCFTLDDRAEHRSRTAACPRAGAGGVRPP